MWCPKAVSCMGFQEASADLKVSDFQMMGFNFHELKLQRVEIHDRTPRISWMWDRQTSEVRSE